MYPSTLKPTSHSLKLLKCNARCQRLQFSHDPHSKYETRPWFTHGDKTHCLQIYECSWQSLSALCRGQVDGAFVYSSYLTIHCWRCAENSQHVLQLIYVTEKRVLCLPSSLSQNEENKLECRTGSWGKHRDFFLMRAEKILVPFKSCSSERAPSSWVTKQCHLHFM